MSGRKINRHYVVLFKIMLSFLLPLATKVISDAVNKIPENEELGEKLIEICIINPR